MPELLYVRSVGLCARTALQTYDRGEDYPCVVCHAGMVYDANAPALKKHVTLGMQVKEAKVLLQDKAAFFDYKPEEYETARDALLLPCLTFSSWIQAGRAGEGLVDLTGHPQPFDVAATLLSTLHRHTGLPLLAGIAPSVWLSRRSATVCDTNALNLGILPVEPVTDPAGWLAPQTVNVLTPLANEDLKRLRNLGFDRVSQVQKIALPLLERQFPKRGAFIQQTALGKLADPIKPNYPSKMVVEEVHLENSESSLEIDGALRFISTALADQLCIADEEAGSIALALVLESGEHCGRSKKLIRPTHSANALYIALGQLFRTFPIVERVETVRVQLLDLERSKRRQIVLPACGSDKEAKQYVSSVLKRVEATHGTGAVKPANSFVPTFNEAVLKEWRRATGWR